MATNVMLILLVITCFFIVGCTSQMQVYPASTSEAPYAYVVKDGELWLVFREQVSKVEWPNEANKEK